MSKPIITTNTNISCMVGTTFLTKQNFTEEFKEQVYAAQTDEELLNLFGLKYANIEDQQKSFRERINSSKVLFLYGDSVVLEGVSKLNMPSILIESILEAEEKQNTKLLNSYINFWKLCLRNPNEYARNNLFWYMKTWGIELSENGLFYLYRNAVSKSNNNYFNSEVISLYNRVLKNKKSPKNYTIVVNKKNNTYSIINHNKYTNQNSDLTLIGNLKETYKTLNNTQSFTDAHSGTSTIKIGQFTSMERSKCDEVQENDCSKGFHGGAKGWLKPDYYGDTPLKILINPMDVVAIPPIDNYGKIRFSKYLPTQIVKWDKDENKNDIIIEALNDKSFEDYFLDDIEKNPVYYDTIKVEANILSLKNPFYSIDNGKDVLEQLINGTYE